MIWGRKNRRIAELVARVEQLVEQRDEARRDAAAVRGADQLQARLDDYLGLNTSRVHDGRHWQSTRKDLRDEVTK